MAHYTDYTIYIDYVSSPSDIITGNMAANSLADFFILHAGGTLIEYADTEIASSETNAAIIQINGMYVSFYKTGSTSTYLKMTYALSYTQGGTVLTTRTCSFYTLGGKVALMFRKLDVKYGAYVLVLENFSSFNDYFIMIGLYNIEGSGTEISQWGFCTSPASGDTAVYWYVADGRMLNYTGSRLIMADYATEGAVMGQGFLYTGYQILCYIMAGMYSNSISTGKFSIATVDNHVFFLRDAQYSYNNFPFSLELN